MISANVFDMIMTKKRGLLMQKLLIIVGPTAIGKSTLAVQLAQKFNGEIISGDSMQIYKELSIGTAKIKEEEMGGVPHYLVGMQDVSQPYSVSDFQKQGRQLIKDMANRKKLPIVVGGTGLYIESLIYDVSHGGSVESSERVRQYYHCYAKEKGNKALWDLLANKDWKAAEKIHENNVRRLVRALEVIHLTGQKFSDFQKEREQKTPLFNPFIIGLNTEREQLYKRINDRVDLMFAQGLVAEAKWLRKTVDQNHQAVKAIGYKELFPYFAGEIDINQAKSQIKQNSRRYAKRQLTWFKNRTGVDKWYDIIEDSKQIETMEEDIKKFIGCEVFGSDK